jgi:hypothetical protein
MTGPEHYKEAERIIAQAMNQELPVATISAIAATAQVHATLALAAASAMPLPT